MLSLTHIVRGSLAPVLAALAVACGAETVNDAPILDSIEAPLTVRAQNGSYAIPVTLLFHDNDTDAVTRLHYRLPPNIDGMVDVPTPNPNRESAVVTIVIEASALDGSDPNETTVALRDDGHENEQRAKAAKDDRDHGRGNERNRARALQLSVVDGRGAESLPQSSTVTLD